MGLFDFFKKKDDEPEYDATNIEVADLQVGFIFDYDLQTWEVLEVYEYDWGDNFFSFEFKVSNGTDIRFLSYEEDDEVILQWTQKVKPIAIDPTLGQYIVDNDKAKQSIVYNGVEYFLESETPGFYHELGNEDWTEFISFNYGARDEKYIICFEQWGENEFEASAGIVIKPFEISNILPASNN